MRENEWDSLREAFRKTSDVTTLTTFTEDTIAMAVLTADVSFTPNLDPVEIDTRITEMEDAIMKRQPIIIITKVYIEPER